MAEHPYSTPFERFREWYDDARARVTTAYPDAMCLSTATRTGSPSSRIVLLKEMDERGFVFYTNQQSRKSAEISANPAVALNFFWVELGRQIRIEGVAEPTSDAESDAYFATRPRDSQIGAWASLQSQPMGERSEFEQRIADISREYEGRPVPRPPHWGGWRVVPQRIEFWQEEPFRLHKRDVYLRADGASAAGWVMQVLYP